MSNKFISEEKGDLIKADVDMIVQQCNCLTVKAHGLSAYIKQHLGVDPYGKRKHLTKRRNLAVLEDRNKVGTIILYGKKTRRPRYVACLFAQFSPGKPGAYYQDVCQGHVDPVTGEIINDNKQNREIWFQRCLDKLARQMVKLKCQNVAFPHGIGCGLAGGSWPIYLGMIQSWAETHQSEFKVIIIRKN